MHWEIFTMPIIAAFIGWGTNVIAIKMLFWPRRPIRVPFLGFEFLGVLPKRQGDIAQSIGQVLNDDLLPVQDLIDAVNTHETREKVTDLICENIELKINRVLPKFVLEHTKDVVMRYERTWWEKKSTPCLFSWGTISVKNYRQVDCWDSWWKKKFDHLI